MKFETRAVIGSRNNEHGALVPPIHLSSTFEIPPGDTEVEFAYQRVSNPSRAKLEALVASLDGVRHGFAFATGMAATSAVFSELSQGDDALVMASVYGGTYRYAQKVFPRQGITGRFVREPHSLSDEDFQPNTKLLFIESPTNPTLRVVDIRRMAELAHRNGALLVVDNTFMTPLLQRPFELGADVVIQSATKFLAGHSDLLAGVITTDNDELAEKYRVAQKNWGGVLDPTSCVRLIQSIKTMPLRLKQQQQNAEQLIEFFCGHPRVKQVYFPGWYSEAEKAIQAAQAQGVGAVFSIEFDDTVDWKVFGASLAIAPFAVSLGDVSTLLVHPASTTHEDMDANALAAAGISQGLIRIAVGIEDSDDLIQDFAQGIAKAVCS